MGLAAAAAAISAVVVAMDGNGRGAVRHRLAAREPGDPNRCLAAAAGACVRSPDGVPARCAPQLPAAAGFYAALALLTQIAGVVVMAGAGAAERFAPTRIGRGSRHGGAVGARRGAAGPSLQTALAREERRHGGIGAAIRERD